MTILPPSSDVLKAFEIKDKPILLKGGQGTTWRAGDYIIKPVDSEEETSWSATIINNLPQDSYRLAQYKKTIDDKWVYNGWSVSEFLEGELIPHHWAEKISVCKGFNNLLTGIPKPDFIDKRTHPWAIAGKMTWDELPLAYDPRMNEYIFKVKNYLKPITVQEQIVHGDITGNMLFADSLPPAIIDFTPTWRAKEYALAILIVDAITWEGADESIFTLVESEHNFFQHLLRAALFRTLVTSEFYRQHKVDRLNEMPIHNKTLDVIIKNYS